MPASGILVDLRHHASKPSRCAFASSSLHALLGTYERKISTYVNRYSMTAFAGRQLANEPGSMLLRFIIFTCSDWDMREECNLVFHNGISRPTACKRAWVDSPALQMSLHESGIQYHVITIATFNISLRLSIPRKLDAS